MDNSPIQQALASINSGANEINALMVEVRRMIEAFGSSWVVVRAKVPLAANDILTVREIQHINGWLQRAQKLGLLSKEIDLR